MPVGNFHPKLLLRFGLSAPEPGQLKGPRPSFWGHPHPELRFHTPYRSGILGGSGHHTPCIVLVSAAFRRTHKISPTPQHRTMDTSSIVLSIRSGQGVEEQGPGSYRLAPIVRLESEEHHRAPADLSLDDSRLPCHVFRSKKPS